MFWFCNKTATINGGLTSDVLLDQMSINDKFSNQTNAEPECRWLLIIDIGWMDGWMAGDLTNGSRVYELTALIGGWKFGNRQKLGWQSPRLHIRLSQPRQWKGAWPAQATTRIHKFFRRSTEVHVVLNWIGHGMGHHHNRPGGWGSRSSF